MFNCVGGEINTSSPFSLFKNNEDIYCKMDKDTINIVPLSIFILKLIFYLITNIGVLAWKIIFLAMLGLNNLANIFRL